MVRIMVRKELSRRPSIDKPVSQIGLDRIFQEGVWEEREFELGAGIERHARQKVEQERKVGKNERMM